MSKDIWTAEQYTSAMFTINAHESYVDAFISRCHPLMLDRLLKLKSDIVALKTEVQLTTEIV